MKKKFIVFITKPVGNRMDNNEDDVRRVKNTLHDLGYHWR